MNNPFGTRGPSRLDIEITKTERTTRISLRGETDISNHSQLRAALASVEPDAVHEVHLLLADLAFCDVRAVCVLLTFAQEIRQNGGEVSVLDANPLVRLMATLLEVDGELGLREPGPGESSPELGIVFAK